MKHIITREAKRITSYPKEVVNYLSEEKNWIEVDPDSPLAESAFFSYPDKVYILSLKNASKEITNFFETKGEYKESFVLKKNVFDDSVEDDLDELTDEEYDEMNYNVVFAYVFIDEGEDDIHNEDLFETKDHAFIFNGLELKGKEYEEQALSALNVQNYTVF